MNSKIHASIQKASELLHSEAFMFFLHHQLFKIMYSYLVGTSTIQPSGAFMSPN